MWPKDLLAISDLTVEQVQELFALVADMKRDRAKYAESCKGRILGMLFRKPSTRTRVSFETAIHQLGGKGMLFRPDELQLGRGETVADTARVLSRYIDAMMIRTFAHSEVVEFGKYASIPTVNGLTDYLHPCQGLTDYFTMWEKVGCLKGLKVTYLGDGNNVAHSLILGASKLGVHLTLATPGGFQPDPEVLKLAKEDAKRTGAKFDLVEDPIKGVRGARVIYTDVWASMGQEEEEKERARIFKAYQINLKLLKHAASDWVFMHCLPAHRGHEVTDDVCDHPQSVIFDQAENRLHVQKGILHKLINRGL
jgi:ornithine carbamoyltransferase